MAPNTPNTAPIAPDAAQPCWLTAEEAAALLRVHVTTIHEMCRRGDLVAIKAGRDWRISAKGLQEKAEMGDVSTKLIHDVAERTARETAALVLERLAHALAQEVAHQRVTSAIPRTRE